MIVIKPNRSAIIRYISQRESFSFSDLDRAEHDLTLVFHDSRKYVEYALSRRAFSTWTISEVLFWNRTVLDVLLNIYFPLLENDDCSDLGERVSPSHMFEILMQRDRFSDLKDFRLDDDYKKKLNLVISYMINNESEKHSDCLDRILSRDYEQISIQDLYDLHGQKPNKDCFLPKAYMASEKEEPREARIGDWVRWNRQKYKINRIYSDSTGRLIANYFPLDECVGVGFRILKKEQKKPVSRGWNPKAIGANCLSDCIIQDENYLGFRIRPKYLAEVIALRTMGFLTPEEMKKLIFEAWEDWCNWDIWHHIDRMKIFPENKRENFKD